MLADPLVDAVYIALPNDTHFEWVLAAAAAHKHVLCEKPMGVSQAEVRGMIEACDAAEVLLAEAFMTPFHPRSLAVDA
ncbi:MAG: Gfo/Idh/MocA family oxidoreductase, partial [Actinobacteria bacterium]|nr:Gfo/Idh/MocA family oxidoreductase [Actinomycetota bacterium]